MSIVPVIVGAIVILSIPLSAQQKQSAEQYRKQLSELQNKEKQLREEIAREQAAILAVKEKISASKKRVAELKQKKLDLLGVTEAHIIRTDTEIEKLSHLLRQQSALSDEVVFQDSITNTALQQRFQAVTEDPTLALPSMQKKYIPLKELYESHLRRLEEIASRPAAATVEEVAETPVAVDEASSSNQLSATSYTVRQVNGAPESLYRIAEQVYGDAHQRPKIYRANKAAIDKNFNRFKRSSSDTSNKNPSDLIYPGQVLVIPR